MTLQPFRSLSCEFKKHENCQTQAIAQAERDTKEALRYVKREKELFDLIERGENLKKIREILEWDPKKYRLIYLLKVFIRTAKSVEACK